MQTGNWFQSLPADVRQDIERLARSRKFRAGTAVFREGDANSGLHRVVAGQIHIIGCAQDGTEALMAILRPDDWTGFLANLDGGRYILSACCMTDCEVATLSPGAVAQIFETSVERYKLLARPELQVARRNYRYLVELEGGPPLQRLAYRLLDLASGPHGRPDGALSLDIAVNQEQLGEAARLSRQKVNVLLQMLVARHIVAVSRGSVRIIDADALNTIAQWQR